MTEKRLNDFISQAQSQVAYVLSNLHWIFFQKKLFFGGDINKEINEIKEAEVINETPELFSRDNSELSYVFVLSF